MLSHCTRLNGAAGGAGIGAGAPGGRTTAGGTPSTAWTGGFAFTLSSRAPALWRLLLLFSATSFTAGSTTAGAGGSTGGLKLNPCQNKTKQKCLNGTLNSNAVVF